ncbi:Ribokinase-like protein [Kalaharituber pfeilii]|nr:Ribokinase-like protein [Kalaharituber pfeilii]
MNKSVMDEQGNNELDTTRSTSDCDGDGVGDTQILTTVAGAREKAIHNKEALELPFQPPEELDFVTMGMFIIDEIHNPPHTPLLSIPGGAGLHALYGARLFSPSPTLSPRVAMLIDLGSDFPSPLLTTLQSLRTSSIFRRTPDRLTTRGWNMYGSAEHRAFKYLTPKKRIEISDFFEDGPGPVGSWVGHKMRTLHLICSPSRAEASVQELRSRLLGPSRLARRVPLVVWEPVPDLCVANHRIGMFSAAAGVDVVSPNEEELDGFFADVEGYQVPPRGTVERRRRTEELARRVLESVGIGIDIEEGEREGAGKGCRGGMVIVRCGARGCCVVWRGDGPPFPASSTFQQAPFPPSHSLSPGEVTTVWLPAYHSPSASTDPSNNTITPTNSTITNSNITDSNVTTVLNSSITNSTIANSNITITDSTIINSTITNSANNTTAVVDPTGAGNTFLGGLCVALARPDAFRLAVEYGLHRMVVAAAYGCVAAGFAVEQVGVPALTVVEEGGERWNGEEVEGRLRAFLERTRSVLRGEGK